jgi:diguanylate cyclase (GGDEF)-like protein/PAS domain S-box-containing protein
MRKGLVHILLMEDDAGLARLCLTRLKRAGYAVDYASDGEEGLAKYDAGAYDVVLLDHVMPVYDGLEVIRRLASRGPLPPLVMVTGAGDEQIAVEAMRLGAHDYLVKDAEGGYLDLLPTVIERALRQQSVEEHMRLAAKVFESVAEGILITDPQARIISVNEAFTRITGYTAEEVVGKNPRVLQSGRHGAEFYKGMWDSLIETGQWRGDLWNRRKGGDAFPVWLTISAVKDTRGAVANYVGVFTDIASRKQAEERLHFLATHDPLTGLPNRDLFQDRLMQAIALSRRSNRLIALLVLDLDHLKQVNDSMGHLAGDLLLKSVAESLMGCVRECDTVARLGGDEFVILLPEIQDSQQAASVAERVLEVLSKPFILGGSECIATASIGISLCPAHGENPETLLQNADAAMYRAKERRNCYEFHAAHAPAVA